MALTLLISTSTTSSDPFSRAQSQPIRACKQPELDEHSKSLRKIKRRMKTKHTATFNTFACKKEIFFYPHCAASQHPHQGSTYLASQFQSRSAE